MGRVIKTIEIEGQQAVALFDTGANWTYGVERLLTGQVRKRVTPARVSMGGTTIDIREACLVNGKIEGLDFYTEIVPVQQLGRADEHEIEVVIGARTMEQWEIQVDPRTGTLGLEGLRRREFTEF